MGLEVESDVVIRRVDPEATRRPDFDPFSTRQREGR
jgi:hypothetical protein